MKEIKAFQCEYCLRKYLSKQACGNHELICWHNPINRKCPACCNLSEDGNYCELPGNEQKIKFGEYPICKDFCTY
jgi:hypothetical protein